MEKRSGVFSDAAIRTSVPPLPAIKYNNRTDAFEGVFPDYLNRLDDSLIISVEFISPFCAFRTVISFLQAEI
jgi:hypothetical protein